MPTLPCKKCGKPVTRFNFPGSKGYICFECKRERQKQYSKLNNNKYRNKGRVGIGSPSE